MRNGLCGIALLFVGLSPTSTPSAWAQFPFEPGASYYVPQAGSVAAPLEGAAAIPYFRMCPNNDGGASLPNNARIKVVIRDVNNNPVANIAATDITLLFNGGTAAQGFSGVGADSIIANGTWNTSPQCPDLDPQSVFTRVNADGPTDANGVTYITFGGASSSNPGVYQRNSDRKWGHYDSAIPVVVFGFAIQGRLTSQSANGTYTLRIKNFDFLGGLGAAANQGERVGADDLNSVANNINVNDALSYWRDFDSSGSVTATDLNMVTTHSGHNCGTPNNP